MSSPRTSSRRLLVGLAILLVVGGGAAAVIAARRSPPNTNGTLMVAASIYPLAEFAQQVGGADVRVTNITPAGSEPHDFEPTPQDLVAVYDATVFIYNGSGLDAWADKVAPELAASGSVVVKVADQEDPHTWLDPVLAQREVNLVRDALVQVDPAHAAGYEQRAADYAAQLATLDQQYRDGLASCVLREAVASHGAFNYLAERYGLTITPIAGIDPESEPSVQRIAELAGFVRATGITHIFYETLIDPKLAETIAAETGAQTMVINPIEGLTEAELERGENYVSVMQANLANLRIALQCR